MLQAQAVKNLTEEAAKVVSKPTETELRSEAKTLAGQVNEINASIKAAEEKKKPLNARLRSVLTQLATIEANKLVS